MYFVRPPYLLHRFYHPDDTWHIATHEKVLFLTFDDGPVPEVTPHVLELLAKYNVPATFFCVGENVERNPGIMDDILMCGHEVGNHSHRHLNGWKTSTETYVEDVRRCNELVKSSLFRPPYGKITRDQRKIIADEFKLVFWSVLTGDFDSSIGETTCMKNTIKHTENGSIIVFHDSIKASQKMLHVLPKFLNHFTEQGFRFDLISRYLQSGGVCDN